MVDPVRAHHPLGQVRFALFHQKGPRDTGIVGMWQAQATPKPIIMEALEANHSDFSGLVAHQQDALRFLEVIVQAKDRTLQADYAEAQVQLGVVVIVEMHFSG